MAKPEHQWETASHLAYRVGREVLDERLSADPRAEAFKLVFGAEHGGGTRQASLGLEAQYVDAEALERDEQVRDCVAAWLIARGARQLRIYDHSGVLLLDEAIAPSSLAQTPGQSVKRIITLSPSGAELVHALGVFDRVIACEDSSDFPPEVSALERLGPDLGPKLDRVAELKPDLVVSSLTVPGMERVVSGLRRRGVKQFVCAPRGLEDVRTEIRALSIVLGVRDEGERALALFDAEGQDLLDAQVAGAVPVRVFLEWWPRPIFTPGRDCYSNELIALAGGVNVCADHPGSSFEISPEGVVATDPEVYFISWCGVAADKLDPRRVIERPGFEKLAVAKRGAVYPLDEAFAGRPGPRMLEAARIMARAIRGVGA